MVESGRDDTLNGSEKGIEFVSWKECEYVEAEGYRRDYVWAKVK